MVDVVLEVAALKRHETDDGGGIGGRCDAIGLERLVDERHGFGGGLAFSRKRGSAAGVGFGYDVEEAARSTLFERVGRRSRGCWDQGPQG